MRPPKVPILQMRNIHLDENGVPVLRGLDFDLYAGEVHALVGEPHSGKSGIVRLLSGETAKTRGGILINGTQVERLDPSLSFRFRIGIVFQYPGIIDSLTAFRNICVGRLSCNLFHLFRAKRLKSRCMELFDRFGATVDLKTPGESLSGSQKTFVELVRALVYDPDIIVLDEISSRLDAGELEKLFSLLREYRKKGKAILYIAHKVDEVFQIADRVTILKNGQRRGTEHMKNLDRFKLLKLAYSFVFSVGEDDKAAKQLFMLKQLNETLINDIPIGIVILDSEERVYLSNQVSRSLLGFTEKSIRGIAARRLLAERMLSVAQDILRAIGSKERRVWERVPFDVNRHLKIQVFPFRDEEALYMGTILMIEDVSMDYFVKEYLAKAEKITSIAELAAGVAHEINNPLGIIQNYVAILKENESDGDSRTKLSKIEKELTRIEEIVGSLLSFSRNQEQHIKKVNVSELVDEVIVLLSHKIHDKCVNVSKESVPPVIEVVGDENKLKQLLLNLINNSIEAVLNEGLIEIRLAEDRPNRQVHVRISDNGYGIPKEISSEIFTPFFSTKLDKKNTGLGLSICQNIVETHRGTIRFESDPGNRTTFVVTLPL